MPDQTRRSTALTVPAPAEQPVAADAAVTDADRYHWVCCDWTEESEDRAIALCGFDATDLPWVAEDEENTCRVCLVRNELPCELVCPRLVFGEVRR